MIEAITTFDVYINSIVPLLHNSFTNPIFITITTIFTPEVFLVWFLLLLALIIYKKKYFIAGFLFFGVAGSQAVKMVIKYITDRPRPENPFELSAYGSSFPSGHAATGVFFLLAAYYLLTPYLPHKWRSLVQAMLIFGMVAVPFSRLFVQVHYLSDIVAGSLLGIVSFIFTLFVFNKLKKYLRNSNTH